jgi:hypothetical protein
MIIRKYKKNIERKALGAGKEITKADPEPGSN